MLEMPTNPADLQKAGGISLAQIDTIGPCKSKSGNDLTTCSLLIEVALQ
jgi:hypothetical protein